MGGTSRHSGRKCPCGPHLKQTRGDPIPLNTVWAAAADVAADTVHTAGTVPVIDIAGAAADIAADARAALAGAAADTAVVRLMRELVSLMPRQMLDIYRRACRVRRHRGLHVPRSARSGRRFWL